MKASNPKCRYSQGFTLIELAIALAVAGILMAGGLELYGSIHRQQQIETTYKNMDAIVDALSIYAASAGRVPCPADPGATDATFGWERGVKPSELPAGQGHFPVGRCDPKSVNGILPFMTLGLPASMAKDGWGHYFTYAISPVFAQANAEFGPPSATAMVHGRCRSPAWVNMSERTNRNPVKARFCCADQLPQAFDTETDLVITHTSAGAPLSPVRIPNASGNYDELTKTTTTTVGKAEVGIHDDSAIEAPAFVLVSHGPDGRGALVGSGSDKRSDVPAGGPEYINASNDRIFVDGTWNLSPGQNHFDDIVRWMTQDGIMAAHGALSCSYP